MKIIFILSILVFASCKTAKNTSAKNDETKIEQSNTEGGIVERTHEPIQIKAEIVCRNIARILFLELSTSISFKR